MKTTHRCPFTNRRRTACPATHSEWLGPHDGRLSTHVTDCLPLMTDRPPPATLCNDGSFPSLDGSPQQQMACTRL